MSRNRERAKERKERLRKQQEEGAADGGGQQHLHRENVPGQLDHASHEVDEAEASIVEGASGEEAEGLTEAELVAAEQADEAAHPEHVEAIPADERDGAKISTPPGGAPTTGKGGPRFVQFLRASWAELQRVQWPDRRQVGQGTAVTLGFVVIAGAYLGAADAVAQRVVDLIL